MMVNIKMIIKKEKEFIIIIMVIYMRVIGKKNKKEGKGIMYYNNGDRIMGNFSNNKPIGKHVMLTKDGEVQTFNN